MVSTAEQGLKLTQKKKLRLSVLLQIMAAMLNLMQPGNTQKNAVG